MNHSPQQIDDFYLKAIENKHLMEDIFVVPPVRPAEGVAIGLHQMLCAWYNAGVQHSIKEDGMGGFIDVTRGNIVNEFLNNRTERFLMMIDSDTEPPIDLPWLLVRHEAPVVGSCIVSFNPKGRRMLCFTRPDKLGTPRMIDVENGDKIPATGLAEVPHCGTGAMMIRRDVLESFTGERGPDGFMDVAFLVPDEVKARGIRSGKLLEGEDIRFCKQVRAKGFKVYVDLEAHCHHVKVMKIVFPPSLRDPSLDVKDWVAPSTGMAFTNE